MPRQVKQDFEYDFVLAADLHIREKSPECRTDDIIETQERKWAFIRKVCGARPFLVAGDVFDKWKPSPWLIGKAAEWLPPFVYCIAGQHDLPAHNAERWDEGGLGTLAKAGRINLLPNTGEGFYSGEYLSLDAFLIHKLIYQGKEPFPGAAKVGGTAKSLLKQFPDYALILSGDNHQTFAEELDGRLLVNPGNILRNTASQIDHRPCVFGWNSQTNKVQPFYIPIENGAVTREHLEKEAKRDERLDAFANQLKGTVEIGLSFQDNLEKYISQNDIRPGVANILREAVE